jgi:hypothetical protein
MPQQQHERIVQGFEIGHDDRRQISNTTNCKENEIMDAPAATRRGQVWDWGKRSEVNTSASCKRESVEELELTMIWSPSLVA